VIRKPGKGAVTGIGSALVDILIHEDEGFIANVGAVKGGMIYVDQTVIDQTLSKSGKKPIVASGGSACNTIVGIGRLGAEARFVGKCGNGLMASLFESDLKANDVQPCLQRSKSKTGRVLSIITPDAQRSMLTFLGASAEATPDEISERDFSGAFVVHVEGYLLFNEQLIQKAMQAAKAASAKISLDLASFNVVEASRSYLKDLVERHVDILIANEDEARAYTGFSDPDRALLAMTGDSEIAVVKLGERGSIISNNGKTHRIEPVSGGGAAVDTTGAGDLWAAGFLYGMANGYSIEQAGWIGSLCGYEVCQVIGAKIPDEGWNRIKAAMRERFGNL